MKRLALAALAGAVVSVGLGCAESSKTAGVENRPAIAAPSATRAGSRQVSVNLSDKEITQGMLSGLSLRTDIQRLDLGHTGEPKGMVVDDGALQCVRGMVNLQNLSLANTSVGDGGLQHLEKLAKLRSLNLDGTKVTDAGLEQLASLKSLQVVKVRKTKVTEAGIKKLQAAIPGCEVSK
jgi:hypothetical protein